MRNVSPDQWAAMTPQEQDAFMEENEKPYMAANGHLLYLLPQYSKHDERPIYTTAMADCHPRCPACASGDPLPGF